MRDMAPYTWETMLEVWLTLSSYQVVMIFICGSNTRSPKDGNFHLWARGNIDPCRIRLQVNHVAESSATLHGLASRRAGLKEVISWSYIPPYTFCLQSLSSLAIGFSYQLCGGEVNFTLWNTTLFRMLTWQIISYLPMKKKAKL